MFCPRCGSQNAETTKFCRQCGLPMNQLAHYVQSGGTAPLAPLPPDNIGEGFTPKQKLVLTIMLFVFMPALLGVIGQGIGLGDLAGIPAVLMPFGIVWAVFRYKNQLRRLKYQQMQQQIQQPMQQPQQYFQPQAQQPPLQSPPTNPIARPVSGSVTEDETQRLPEKNQ
ncbi:MAG: zinc ribbon domain-containing protein [Acidobacteria bacterium]|nr:zinc ribbon domain-containing protein [Acidobacteriota bacterium]